jgi:nitrate reductase (NAD(P)H)
MAKGEPAPLGRPEEAPLEPGSEDYKLHLPQSAVQPEDLNTKDDWVPRCAAPPPPPLALPFSFCISPAPCNLILSSLHLSILGLFWRPAPTQVHRPPLLLTRRRHPECIRLTGRHPFNAEPPPARLMERFITPAPLHYVRNHGAVPPLEWDAHRLAVVGLVNSPLELTMADILAMPAVDVTCTLVCAGNRRKEQNMVKKTIGFNWGPAGTGCSTWTGVRLGDVLARAGLAPGAAHVCLRGPKGELPRGEDGSYGTSISLRRAVDPAFDVILAYKQNGRLLLPDHGAPLRVIIPGYIGGRMIKWLEEVSVAADESSNYFHFHDNRVLPSHVDEVAANAEGWWYKPDFIINDLNINSAVTAPGHGEARELSAVGGCAFSGYAYSNGNKIIRCELSLDDGATWRLADITQRAPPTAAGKHWAWVWWALEVPFADLLGCREVLCRAWDATMNTQPNALTWNVMGMMNNCVYRVKVHPRPTPEGRFALAFEHPTLAGPAVGGWMNREGGDGAAAANAVVAPPPPAGARVIAMEEVEKHDTKASAWFAHEGRVYDATPFLTDHPGGADSILLVAGTDATDEFNAIHSTKARAMLADYYLGELAGADGRPVNGGDAGALPVAGAEAAASGHRNGNGAAAPAAANGNGAAAADADPVALNPKKRLAFPLIEKHELSHNVRRFRFGLPSPAHRLGLPVGKHVFLYAAVGGELVMRAYTPSSSDATRGFFDLVVKIYRAGESERFPAGGKMSQHLDTLAIGDCMEFKGPVGHVEYLGRGAYTLSGDPAPKVTKINMIAGGTGITPMFQVLQAALADPEDATEIALLYANQSPDDILLREELDALAAADARFKVWYTVDRVAEGEAWPFSVGFISEVMVRERLFPAAPDAAAFLCGPPPMIKFACLPNLEAVGFAPEQCIQF